MNKKRLSEAMDMSRKDLRILVGALTGHLGIKSFLYNINLSNDSICRFCNEVSESITHVLCRCRFLSQQRKTHFREEFLVTEDIKKQKYKDIVNFIKDVGVY